MSVLLYNTYNISKRVLVKCKVTREIMPRTGAEFWVTAHGSDYGANYDANDAVCLWYNLRFQSLIWGISFHDIRTRKNQLSVNFFTVSTNAHWFKRLI